MAVSTIVRKTGGPFLHSPKPLVAQKKRPALGSFSFALTIIELEKKDGCEKWTVPPGGTSVVPNATQKTRELLV